MTQRYFSPATLSAGQSITLTGPEAHHMRDVMRLAAGERVTLFDGGGCEFVAEIFAAKRAGVELRILERLAIDREPPCEVVLGVALPKGERQRWLVEKATELGVRRLVPLAAERGVAAATAGALQRLRRGVIEAAKQCGRNRLMEIGEPLALPTYLAQAPAGAQRLIAHLCPRRDSATAASKSAPSATGHAPWGDATAIWLACGPEGGFSDGEITLAQAAGWMCVSLGPTILRVETAAIALAALAAIRQPTHGP